MRIDIDVNIRSSDSQFGSKLDTILAMLVAAKSREEQIMATLDEVLSATTDESTKLDSLSTFIAGLKQQIADALAGVTLPPAVQAKVDQVFSNVQSNTAKVQTALDANVTPAP